MIDAPDNVDQTSSVDIAGLSDASAEWLRIASTIYNDSTTYLDATIRPKWEVSIANANNIHPPGSRYNKEIYAKRSKHFRPKIQPTIRRHIAALAAALFTNNDCVFLEPEASGDKLAAASARMMQGILQHHLDNSLMWFLTSLGAYYDAMVYSVCISKQQWLYDEYNDNPSIDLLKPENFRFDPNCDWRNPTGTSPYLIEIIPMYAGDVLDRIAKDQTWAEYTLPEILSAGAEHAYDTTRLAREGNRAIDPTSVVTGNEFTTVYVHFNIYRRSGVDYAFYTLGINRLLTEPTPLKKMYRHGRELYRVGFCTLEPHKAYPTSLVESMSPLQDEVNRVVNNRQDNVNLVLNKRYIIKRSGNVDISALVRNVSGGGIMVDDVNDVKVLETPDVTRSAYEEQDRLNAEIDDVGAVLTANTVQANRNMNETVGGMNLLASGASADQELQMELFIFSWVKPVLNTLLELCKQYETNDSLINKHAAPAGFDNFANADPEAKSEIMLLKSKLTVNVGMGNTNPEQKIKRLMLAINTTAQMPGAQTVVDWQEVITEVFSFAGYGDGSRFMISDDKKQEMQNQPPQVDPKLQVAQHNAQAQQEMLQMKLQSEASIIAQREESERMLLQMKQQHAEYMEQLKIQVMGSVEGARLQTDRDKAALASRDKMNEMHLKATMGSGI